MTDQLRAKIAELRNIGGLKPASYPKFTGTGASALRLVGAMYGSHEPTILYLTRHPITGYSIEGSVNGRLVSELALDELANLYRSVGGEPIAHEGFSARYHGYSREYVQWLGFTEFNHHVSLPKVRGARPYTEAEIRKIAERLLEADRE